MIGSNTLVIKEKGSFRVRIFGGWPGDFTFEDLVKFETNHEDKPDATNLTDVDCYKILSSHQCNSEFEPNYSEFAGDALYLLDLDTKTVVSRQDYVKQWEANNQDKIVQMASELELKRQGKIKEIEKSYEQLEQDVLHLMEIRKETKRKDYNFNDASCEYDPHKGEVSFFIGHKNKGIDGFESFHEWFLKRRKNLKVLIKRRQRKWSENCPDFIIDAYTFTHKNKKWLWHHAWGDVDKFYEFVK